MLFFHDFLRYQILDKWANLLLPLNAQKPKVLQLLGASSPDPPPGALLLDPAVGSALRPPL